MGVSPVFAGLAGDVQHIRINHHLYQTFEIGLTLPTQLGLCLSAVAPQELYLSRTEELRSHIYQQSAGLSIITLLINALAFETNVDTNFLKGSGNELTNGVGLVGSQYIVARLILLQHSPHTLYIVTGKAPVTLGIHVAQRQLLLLASQNVSDSQGDLTGNKVITATRRLVIKQDTVAGKQIIRLSVIYSDPVGIQLSYTVRALRVEGSLLALRSSLRDTAEQLGGRSLIETDRQAALLDGL